MEGDMKPIPQDEGVAEQLIQDFTAKFERQCRHFQGANSLPCLAGVRPTSVRQDHLPLEQRFPCMCPETNGCDKREINTRERARAIAEGLLGAAETFVTNLEAGKCGECGQSMTGKRAVGRCDYAEPCGHRIGTVR